MATSDTYTLVISEVGVPSSHAASHTAGGGDEIAVNISQLDDIAANTVLGNLTGATAAVTAVATTGTGNVVRATGPTITLANGTGLPLATGVTGVLPIANGGTSFDATARGQCYQQNFVTPVVQSLSSTYTAVVATSIALDTAVPAVNMTLGTTNTLSLANTSGATRVFRVTAHVNADAGANEDTLGMQLRTRALPSGIYVPQPASEIRWTTSHNGTTPIAVDLILTWFVNLADDIEVAVFMANHTATRNVNIHNMKLSAHAVI